MQEVRDLGSLSNSNYYGNYSYAHMVSTHMPGC